MRLLNSLGSNWGEIWKQCQRHKGPKGRSCTNNAKGKRDPRVGVAQTVASWHPGWEEMQREWGKEEEMEIKWGNGERFTLCISSFSLHFLPLSPFPTSKFVTFCCKMLNKALLSQTSHKHIRYEEIILGQIWCEEAPQVVATCYQHI